MNLNEVVHNLEEFSFRLTVMLYDIDGGEPTQVMLEAIKKIKEATHVISMFNECSNLTLQQELALDKVCQN